MEVINNQKIYTYIFLGDKKYELFYYKESLKLKPNYISYGFKYKSMKKITEFQ